MLSRSLKEQIICRWREFRREPSAFFWVVFMPVLWMVVLGFALSDPKPETYGIGVVSSGKHKPNLVEILSKSSQIRLKAGDDATLKPLLQRGDITLIVAAMPNGIQFTLDPANPEAIRAKDFTNGIIQTYAGRKDPLDAMIKPITAKGTRYVDFLIPGLLGLSIMTSSLFGVGMTIVSNRKENLLKRYLTTPMKPYEYIVSHLVGRMNILVAEFIAVMLAGFIIFDFNVFGNYLAYIAVSVLGASAFTAVALLCASRTKSIPMISGLTNLISLPMIMLSGVFFSKNNFPDWLQTVTGYLPLTALNDALRKIALEGQTIQQLSFEMLVLITYTVICGFIAHRAFKWY